MPEARPAGVAQEPAPPFLVRERAGPALERVEVAPVLAHTGVGRAQGVPQRLVPEEPVGSGRSRTLNLFPERAERAQPTWRAHTHAQVDDDQIGICREIDR